LSKITFRMNPMPTLVIIDCCIFTYASITLTWILFYLPIHCQCEYFAVMSKRAPKFEEALDPNKATSKKRKSRGTDYYKKYVKQIMPYELSWVRRHCVTWILTKKLNFCSTDTVNPSHSWLKRIFRNERTDFVFIRTSKLRRPSFLSVTSAMFVDFRVSTLVSSVVSDSVGSNVIRHIRILDVSSGRHDFLQFCMKGIFHNITTS